MPKQRPLADRFNEKVDRSGGPDACWIWTAARTKQKDGRGGYGKIRVGPRSESRFLNATHVAWLMEHGELPAKHVLHVCDNPPCCNPKHLFEGTNLDNMRDMKNKARSAFGERHGHARLTEASVREIRDSEERLAVLADRYDMSRTEIGMVRSGRRWSSVKVPSRVPLSRGPRRGELSPLAKLTTAQVAEIRSRYATGMETQKQLGNLFGVSQTMVGKIVRGRSWRDHVG